MSATQKTNAAGETAANERGIRQVEDTMNEIIPFNFKGTQIRVVEIDGTPWWVASDVCRVLGLTNPTKTLLRLKASEKGLNPIQTPGEHPESSAQAPRELAVAHSSL